VVLLGLMVVGMVLETLGASLMIPAIALLTQRDVARTYPALQPTLHALGTPSEQTRVIGGMLALVGVYLIKGILTQKIAHDYNPPPLAKGGEGGFPDARVAP
jgi:hypothetical protein